MPRVLFVCAGNTCRSPLAAALANRWMPCVSAESAGTHPGYAVAANTVVLAAELAGVSLADHQPRDVSGLLLESFDLIVALDDLVAHDLVAMLPQAAQLVNWSLPDPYGESLEVYRRCADEITARLGELLA
jgi:protein-tyrosine-phosphatase